MLLLLLIAMTINTFLSLNLPVKQKGKPTHPSKELGVTQRLNGFRQEAKSTPNILQGIIPRSIAHTYLIHTQTQEIKLTRYPGPRSRRAAFPVPGHR